MTDTPLLIEQTDSVCTLTINLPEKRNPIAEAAIVDAFEQALHDINRNNSIRVVVITGAGKAFSSGGDVKVMAAADCEPLFKKVVIADYLGVFVDKIYSNPPSYSSVLLIIATYFFAIQNCNRTTFTLIFDDIIVTTLE